MTDLPTGRAVDARPDAGLGDGLASEIAGPDDRAPVTDPAAYPYTCIAAIFGRMQRFEGTPAPDHFVMRGTGFAVGRSMLVTAAHVIFDPAAYGDARRGFANFVGILLGSPDGRSSPFGEIWTSDIEIFPAYEMSRRPEDDVGVLRIDRAVLSRVIMPTALPDAALLRQPVEVPGYDPNRGRQFCTARDRIRHAFPERLFHQADTESGQSGAPMLLPQADAGRTAQAVGVHGWPFARTPPPLREELLNSGPRFRPDVMSWLASRGRLG